MGSGGLAHQRSMGGFRRVNRGDGNPLCGVSRETSPQEHGRPGCDRRNDQSPSLRRPLSEPSIRRRAIHVVPNSSGRPQGLHGVSRNGRPRRGKSCGLSHSLQGAFSVPIIGERVLEVVPGGSDRPRNCRQSGNPPGRRQGRCSSPVPVSRETSTGQATRSQPMGHSTRSPRREHAPIPRIRPHRPCTPAGPADWIVVSRSPPAYAKTSLLKHRLHTSRRTAEGACVHTVGAACSLRSTPVAQRHVKHGAREMLGRHDLRTSVRPAPHPPWMLQAAPLLVADPVSSDSWAPIQHRNPHRRGSGCAMTISERRSRMDQQGRPSRQGRACPHPMVTGNSLHR